MASDAGFLEALKRGDIDVIAVSADRPLGVALYADAKLGHAIELAQVRPPSKRAHSSLFSTGDKPGR